MESTRQLKAGVLAADVLRVIAKTYATEKTLVKLEVLALAAKLWLVDRERCAPLVQYVLQLARFDLSYDVRDRARFVRNLLFNTTRLADQAKLVFLAQKPVAEPDSDFKERSSYQLGTLSHALGQRCERYRDLPAWPEVPSDPALRKRPDSPLPAGANAAQRTGSAPQKDGEFYSDDDEEGEEEEEEDEEEETTADDEEDEDEEAEEDEDEEEEDDDDDNEEAEEETSDDEKNSDVDEDDDEEEEEDEGNGRAESAPSKTKKLNTTTLAAV